MERTPVEVAQAHHNLFTPEFLEYLPDNTHVYTAFEREAKRVVARGFAHYSARTIVEVLRHHTAVSESSGPYKLSDWHTPYLARLFAVLHPASKNLFEFRKTKSKRAGVSA